MERNVRCWKRKMMYAIVENKENYYYIQGRKWSTMHQSSLAQKKET